MAAPFSSVMAPVMVELPTCAKSNELLAIITKLSRE
jgi:hypothetical protein